MFELFVSIVLIVVCVLLIYIIAKAICSKNKSYDKLSGGEGDTYKLKIHAKIKKTENDDNKRILSCLTGFYEYLTNSSIVSKIDKDVIKKTNLAFNNNYYYGNHNVIYSLSHTPIYTTIDDELYTNLLLSKLYNDKRLPISYVKTDEGNVLLSSPDIGDMTKLYDTFLDKRVLLNPIFGECMTCPSTDKNNFDIKAFHDTYKNCVYGYRGDSEIVTGVKYSKITNPMNIKTVNSHGILSGCGVYFGNLSTAIKYAKTLIYQFKIHYNWYTFMLPYPLNFKLSAYLTNNFNPFNIYFPDVKVTYLYTEISRLCTYIKYKYGYKGDDDFSIKDSLLDAIFNIKDDYRVVYPPELRNPTNPEYIELKKDYDKALFNNVFVFYKLDNIYNYGPVKDHTIEFRKPYLNNMLKDIYGFYEQLNKSSPQFYINLSMNVDINYNDSEDIIIKCIENTFLTTYELVVEKMELLEPYAIIPMRRMMNIELSPDEDKIKTEKLSIEDIKTTIDMYNINICYTLVDNLEKLGENVTEIKERETEDEYIEQYKECIQQYKDYINHNVSIYSKEVKLNIKNQISLLLDSNKDKYYKSPKDISKPAKNVNESLFGNLYELRSANGLRFHLGGSITKSNEKTINTVLQQKQSIDKTALADTDKTPYAETTPIIEDKYNATQITETTPITETKQITETTPITPITEDDYRRITLNEYIINDYHDTIKIEYLSYKQMEELYKNKHKNDT